jgi:maleylacetate reductase
MSPSLPTGSISLSAQERVIYGKAAETAVASEAERYGAQRVFVVSTNSLSKLDNGPLQRIERSLATKYAGTFAAVRSHSPREDVIAIANGAREAQADLLVAVGGGSVIDAAKAALLCIWENIGTPEAMEPYRSGAASNIARKAMPPAKAIKMISVSTTLSASEFTAQAGVTDSSYGKQSFAHRQLVPSTAVLDPAATLDTPAWLLYCTAIRAVDHAVESYCSPLANPITEVQSLQGLRLLYRSLRAMKANPADLQARLDAQFGMWQSIAPSVAGVPMGASHGIGYALGASFDVAHGHTSCVLLPAVLRWNSAVNRERQRALAEAMGAPGSAAAELIAALVQHLEQPGSLRAVGITEADLDTLAASAIHYGPVRANPRPIRSPEDVKEILEMAW